MQEKHAPVRIIFRRGFVQKVAKAARVVASFASVRFLTGSKASLDRHAFLARRDAQSLRCSSYQKQNGTVVPGLVENFSPSLCRVRLTAA
jgi:hypothetical protein